MRAKPETLAIRAANQYRRRDIIGYLGLRYYLDNVCAVRDRWANEISTLLAQYEDHPVYHESWHFKEWSEETKKIEHRRLSLPTPNEILAETAILDACSRAGGAFKTASSVYSYQLATGNEKTGVFFPYFVGFKKRHNDIADAARKYPDGIVVYTDIRKFYPSISHDMALHAWEKSAGEGALNSKYIELGRKLLEGHKLFCNEDEQGILTGPMFSHLIANLVLRPVDESMDQILPNGYFRYVDDIAMVGSRDDVELAEKTLDNLLDQLGGLRINTKKRLEVSTREWLLGENDFADEKERVSWKTFIGKMKQLLVAKPELTEEITINLNHAGFRIRPIDYSNAVKAQSYLTRLHQLSKYGWFRKVQYRANPQTLLNEAGILRTRYTKDFWDLFDRPVSNKYGHKRRIHGLRRYASRLIYLADPRDLPSIAEALSEVPEMKLFEVVFNAISSGDVSELVLYGANATHSAVYPLLATHESVRCSVEKDFPEVRQAKAILKAHGLPVCSREEELLNDDITRFCDWTSGRGRDTAKKMTYFDELASLHGVNSTCRHQDILFTAFDTNEDLISDISELLGKSPS